MLIFPEDDPPVINKAGDISARDPKNRDDLVYDPAEWIGVKSLALTLSQGTLVNLPTLAQFDSGKYVSQWKTVKGDQISLFSSNFEFDGWGYPVSNPKACY